MNLQSIKRMMEKPGVIFVSKVSSKTLRTDIKIERRKVVLSLLSKNERIKQTIFIKLCEDIGEDSTIRRDVIDMVKSGLILVDKTIHNNHFLTVAA